ncbi:MAG TPA: hypothetical protein VGB91_16735 [Rhizomicrobium sp.]
MTKLALVAMLAALGAAAAPAFADAPPGHYDVTPPSRADLDFCLAVMLSAWGR